MSREKNLLKWTILMIAMIQMPALALSPAVASIRDVFSDRSVSTIQTVMALPNLVSPFISLGAFGLTRRIGKKGVIILGICTLVICGVGGLLLHSRFWNLILWGVLVGCAMGWFLPSTSSMMFDNFEEDERRVISGLQTSFINGGGIIFNFLGGIAASIAWFGGYALYLLGIPVVIMAILFIPRGTPAPSPAEADADEAEKAKSRINGHVIFYACVIFFFMFSNTVFSSNISLYMSQTGIGSSVTAGIASAIQMAGGMICGIFFSRLSKKLRDFILLCAFGVLVVGYLIISAFPVLPVVLIGSFIAGCGMSMCMPQCMFDISRHVNSESSVLATSLAMSVAPSLGGFLSPSFFTNLSQLIGGDDVRFRFLFSALVIVVFAAILCVLLVIRRRKESADANLASGA